MLKRFLLAIGLVLLVSNSSLAQSTISCGMPVKSFDNSALAPNTDGVAYALYSNLLYITWQYDFTVDPSAVSMQLEASLDNLSWSVIDTSTTVTGAVRNVSGAYRFVRGHINTHTGGSGLTVTINCTKQSGGSGGGGSGSGYSSIEEEGSALIARTALNFAGTGVTCADDTTKTTCTFTGGAASFPLLGTNGGISAPTYSFASDTDTGMYWSGPGSPDDSTLGFAVDGSSVFGVGNDGVLINGGVLNFEGATVDGTRTSLSVTDPTSNRSLVLPNASGNISLEPASIGFYVLTAAGAAPTARSFTSPTGTIIITNTDGLAGNVGIDVDTTTTVPYSSGVGDPPATCNPPELYYETDVFELSYCSDVNHWEFIITQSAQTDDAVIVGSGTGYGLKVLPNGIVRYTTATNTFSTSAVALASEVTGDLPLANLAPASAASVLLGRGSAGGAGDFQEVTLGSGLTMTNQVLSSTGGGSGYDVSAIATKMRCYHDFMGEVSSTFGDSIDSCWNVNASGGTGLSEVTTSADLANHPGLWEFNNNGTATGNARVISRHLRLTGGQVILECLVKTESALSAAGDRYAISCGINNSSTIVPPTDGCGIIYQDDLNSGKWMYRCATASTETTADSGVTVASNTWYKLRTTINTDGTSVNFMVNSAGSADITTNIPTGVDLLATLGFLKSVGATTRMMHADYVYLEKAVTR